MSIQTRWAQYQPFPSSSFQERISSKMGKFRSTYHLKPQSQLVHLHAPCKVFRYHLHVKLHQIVLYKLQSHNQEDLTQLSFLMYKYRGSRIRLLLKLQPYFNTSYLMQQELKLKGLPQAITP